MTKKVTRNVTTLLASKIFANLLVLVGYAFLFRYFGTYRTGQYQFALAFVMIFGVVVDFGIQQLVIKRVSQHKEQAEKYLGHFFSVEVVLATLIFLILVSIAFANHYDSQVTGAILIAGAGMILNALTIPHTAIISAFEDMHILALVNFGDSLINVGVMAITVLAHRSIIFMASVQGFMAVMHFIVYSFVIKRYVPEPKLFAYLRKLDFKLIKEMFIAALPFGMLVGFSIVYNKIDVIILSHLRGYVENGLYTAAYKFFDSLSFAPAVVSSSLYPFFSAAIKSGNMDAVRHHLRTYTRYMVALAVPMAFGGALVAPKLIVFFGQAFLPGFGALQILLFASAVLFTYSAVNSLMINQLTKYAVVITFANIFINAIGNLLLIPHFGFKVAAVMTLVSELTQATFYFYFVRKKITKFDLFSAFPKPILAGVIMGAVIYPFRLHSLLLTIPTAAVVYAIVLFATGFIKRSDLQADLTLEIGSAQGGAQA